MALVIHNVNCLSTSLDQQIRNVQVLKTPVIINICLKIYVLQYVMMHKNYKIKGYVIALNM